MIPYPIIDPIAFSLPEMFGYGPFPVRWYGIAYICGFFSGLWYMKHLIKHRNQPLSSKALTVEHVDDLFVWVVLGVILGGRLGYVLFYNLSYFIENPENIIALWQGGMSYHGGMIGVIVAMFLFAWRNKLNPIDIADRVVPSVCFGLFFGRLANFINGELWGRVTDSSVGMIFPHAGNLPRHPSQLYEAVLEGIVLFLILHYVAKNNIKRYQLSGLFLVGYGTFRGLVEFFREPDAHLQSGIFEWVTMGQLLSLPMIVAGIILLQVGEKHSRKMLKTNKENSHAHERA